MLQLGEWPVKRIIIKCSGTWTGKWFEHFGTMCNEHVEPCRNQKPHYVQHFATQVPTQYHQNCFDIAK